MSQWRDGTPLARDQDPQAIPISGGKLLEENTELTTIDESRFLTILDFQRRNMTPKPAVINPDGGSGKAASAGRSIDRPGHCAHGKHAALAHRQPLSR